MAPLQSIPTNIIFGFLGAGKTTAILDLIARKPDTERWAILVNEFGEIGIDGKIIGQTAQTLGNTSGNNCCTVKEIAGGCLCCAAGVPFQVGLNELVRASQPDRLIIEPTGLGHPKQIISTLQNASNHALIALQNVITLVDPRKLSDSRYLNHPNFMQQIELADVLLGSKADLCSPKDIERFWSVVEPYRQSKKHIALIQQGVIALDWLNGLSIKSEYSAHGHHSEESDPFLNHPNAQSWTFSSSQSFNHDALLAWAKSFSSLRLKAVVKTNLGDFAINQSDDDALAISKVGELNGSIVEVIGVIFDKRTSETNPLEKSLAACLCHL